MFRCNTVDSDFQLPHLPPPHNTQQQNLTAVFSLCQIIAAYKGLMLLPVWDRLKKGVTSYLVLGSMKIIREKENKCRSTSLFIYPEASRYMKSPPSGLQGDFEYLLHCLRLGDLFPCKKNICSRLIAVTRRGFICRT